MVAGVAVGPAGWSKLLSDASCSSYERRKTYLVLVTVPKEGQQFQCGIVFDDIIFYLLNDPILVTGNFTCLGNCSEIHRKTNKQTKWWQSFKKCEKAQVTYVVLSPSTDLTSPKPDVFFSMEADTGGLGRPTMHAWPLALDDSAFNFFLCYIRT